MKLKDMKGLVESYEPVSPQTKSDDDEKYPYGLRLNISKSVIKALGIDPMGLSIGDSMDISGTCKVCSISMEDHGAHINLQITQFATSRPKKGSDAEFSEGFNEDDD